MENTKIWDKRLNATMFRILEKSKTSNCKRLEKLIVTYLHMYKWNCYASRSIPLSEKKMWKLWGIYSTSYTYFPVPYLFVFWGIYSTSLIVVFVIVFFLLFCYPCLLSWAGSRTACRTGFSFGPLASFAFRLLSCGHLPHDVGVTLEGCSALSCCRLLSTNFPLKYKT